MRVAVPVAGAVSYAVRHSTAVGILAVFAFIFFVPDLSNLGVFAPRFAVKNRVFTSFRAFLAVNRSVKPELTALFTGGKPDLRH